MSKIMITSLAIRLLQEVEENTCIKAYYDCGDFNLPNLYLNYACEMARNLNIRKETFEMCYLHISRKNLLAIMEILWLHRHINYFKDMDILDILIRISTTKNINIAMSKLLLKTNNVTYCRLAIINGIVKYSTLPYCYTVANNYASAELALLRNIKVDTSPYFKLHLADYYINSKRKDYDILVCQILLSALNIAKEEYVEIAANSEIDNEFNKLSNDLYVSTIATINILNSNTYHLTDELINNIKRFVRITFDTFGMEVYDNLEAV